MSRVHLSTVPGHPLRSQPTAELDCARLPSFQEFWPMECRLLRLSLSKMTPRMWLVTIFSVAAFLAIQFAQDDHEQTVENSLAQAQ